jgi:ribosomal protein S12 methylthiotransferase accessory factor
MPPRGAEAPGPGHACPVFEAVAARAADACGVTRLADITGLDRLGLPVWQAVRPAGRALSVHQGKGASIRAARIGALCEAIESHCAEEVEADGPRARFEELEPGARAPHLADYARSRRLCPCESPSIDWCMATDVSSGRVHFLPQPLVSLDLTVNLRSFLDRSSSGLAVGSTFNDALMSAACELIERDAVGAWQRASPAERIACEMDLDSARIDWLGEWRERLIRADLILAFWRLEALAGMPTFVCTVSGAGAFSTRMRSFLGSASHPDPQVALFKALAEALQSRLTFIAAARDDILPSHYQGSRDVAPEALPLRPPGVCGWRWDDEGYGPATIAALVEALARDGFHQVVAKQIGQDLASVSVVKMFIPGLGSLHRSRRRAR